MSKTPTVTEWNQQYPVGTRVKYKPLRLHGVYEESVTTTPAVLDPYGLPTVEVKALPRPVWVGALEVISDVG